MTCLERIPLRAVKALNYMVRLFVTRFSYAKPNALMAYLIWQILLIEPRVYFKRHGYADFVKGKAKTRLSMAI